MIEQSRYLIAALYLGLLSVIFIGMVSVAFKMTQGLPSANISVKTEKPTSVVPQAIMLTVSLALGLFLPAPLEAVLRQIASAFGGY